MWQRSSHDISKHCVAATFVIFDVSKMRVCTVQSSIHNPLYLRDEWWGVMWKIWPNWNDSRATRLHWWSNRGSTDLLVQQWVGVELCVNQAATTFQSQNHVMLLQNTLDLPFQWHICLVVTSVPTLAKVCLALHCSSANIERFKGPVWPVCFTALVIKIDVWKTENKGVREPSDEGEMSLLAKN